MAELRNIDSLVLGWQWTGNIEYDKGFEDGIDFVLNEIDKIPAVEAKPVVHAHWKKENDLFYVCSKCKTTLPYNFEQEYITYWQCNYCPNCGAQMD